MVPSMTPNPTCGISTTTTPRRLRRPCHSDRFARACDDLAVERTVEESIVIEAGPERVYGALADPRRMGEWSPELFRVWLRGDPAEPGTRFVGFNRIGWRVWFTNCRVSVATPGE